MRSLSWKLAGALLLVVIVSIGVMAFLTNRNTTAEFQNYVTRGGMMYTQRVVDKISQYYFQEKGWAGVQNILDTLLRDNNDRLIIADSSGKIVADSADQWEGRLAGDLQLSAGTSIDVSGQTVGNLYILVYGNSDGLGYMGGRGMMGSMGSMPTAEAETAETDFLNRTNNYIWIAGLAAFAVALLLGVFLTRQITRPVRALTIGAEQISQGNLDYRVHIKSQDEIGELARSFNSMAGNLNKSEQSRKQLVSDISHELRTPLTIIEGTVDGIVDGVFPPDREHLESIKEQTTLLTHLVSDLRDLSLAESGQLKLERSPVNIAELVSRKLSQFDPQAREKDIQLKIETSPNIPEVRGDSLRLEQVIANLLSNAIRHSPTNGQVTVSLKATNLAPRLNKPGVVISVTDNGEGISAENLPHVFERFYRTENSRARSEGGVGLGLAIVKQMVEAHGGQVWAESVVGKGSTFIVALPL